MNPYIIPIFITHQGCPQKCIFCNQANITGQHTPLLSADWVSSTIKEGLSRKRKPRDREIQVAFYGGTFTGLNTSLQEETLSAVLPFWEKNEIHSIRISTRPDYINLEKIYLLKQYPVKTVELGIQSMSDKVLIKTRRGHSSNDNLQAVQMLKEAGFQVGAQIMIGLPGEDRKQILNTLKPLFALKPDFIRIYPTLVLMGTNLADIYQKGYYRPLTLEESVEICRDISIYSRKKGIPVIRMGLQADSNLEKNIISGPYHPAFGEIVKAEVLKNKIVKKLQLFQGLDGVEIHIAPTAISLLTGFKRRILNELEEKSQIQSLKPLVDSTLSGEEFYVKRAS